MYPALIKVLCVGPFFNTEPEPEFTEWKLRQQHFSKFWSVVDCSGNAGYSTPFLREGR